MPYLSPGRNNLLEIEYTFDLIGVLKPINISDIMVNQGLRYGMSDGTFEA